MSLSESLLFRYPMFHKSERISASELRDYEYGYYQDLKNGCCKVKIPNSTYRCPFCLDKQDYPLTELLNHASRLARRPLFRGTKDKARHSALQLYIERYLDVNIKSEPVNKDQLFVWPWMGVVANIARELKDGRYVGESGTKLRDEFTLKGFQPLKVHPLWNRSGHSGFAIVEFNRNWDGFINAMNFERSFEVDHCGERDYYYSSTQPGNRLYGWVARDDDYHSKSIVGDHLRKNGDLKTVSGKANIKKLIYYETNLSLNTVMAQKEEMIKLYNDEIKKMQQSDRDRLEKIFMDHEKARLRLEARKIELENLEKDLQKRQAQNENERKKLYLEKKNNEMAAMEQKKADERVMSLAEEHKQEKEKLHKKIHELQRKLDAQQALELEIEQLSGALQVMKHMGQDDAEMKKKMDAIKLDLQDKEEELETMEALNQALVVKERRTNDELQDARKELMKRMDNPDKWTRPFIGVKRMGDLDNKPFVNVAKRKFSRDEVGLKAMELYSQWEDYLRDLGWHPFKILTDKEGNAKEIIDEGDEKLKTLKDEFGDEAFGVVTTALMELNEYNPSCRIPISELWNFEEGRKATLKEGVLHLLRQWKRQRQNERKLES